MPGVNNSISRASTIYTQDCGICNTTLMTGRIIELKKFEPCNHTFHTACVDQKPDMRNCPENGCNKVIESVQPKMIFAGETVPR